MEFTEQLNQTTKIEDKTMKMAHQVPNDKAEEFEQVLKEFGFQFKTEVGDFWTTFRTVQSCPEGQVQFNALASSFID